ncbi:bifunctional riboflavin kinase/FAD synthetase [Petralouisia muris]|jgi:riboflavin kinase/FMN adenylyltransferase|uniref:Bifunctional riboflavin kinase/FAD synthetase n=1 Tax=Petralouisia muris TaxID=3032872 RepID=A0AC61RY21_9FIRM|nr:bifunctional riboflavin kinase/FAD synthetase [Petralouisia muris]TGY96582.1 bifunctional riboflavin kinase/FAD synthetase [Petralouisia muris]
MEYIKQSITFEIQEPTVLSLGKFDGLHRGHELLMEYMAEKKRERKDLKAVIFTFDIPPREQLQNLSAQVLTTNQEKMKLFESIGIDYLIECPFTREVMCMEPETFIEKIAVQLNVKYMVVGTDFRFGHKRRGDYRLLQEYAEAYGYEVKVVDKMQEYGRDISSTFVREEIAAGNMEKANELLGYQFFVEGTVLHGEKMGKAVLGIPTINLLPPKDKLLPPFGVYVTVTECRGKKYPGITNVGCKPTIEGKHPTGVETHLFDVTEEMYGEEVKVSFLTQVRRERKFPDLEALVAQMKQDIQFGKDYFHAREQDFQQLKQDTQPGKNYIIPEKRMPQSNICSQE